MTDAFLDGLKADWRRRDVDLDHIRRRVALRRRRMQAFVAIEILGLAMAILFALWLATHALALGVGLAALGAAAMLVSAGLSLWTVLRLRAPWLRKAAPVLAPQAALGAMLTQLNDAERIVRYWLASATVLALCAGGVGALFLAGQASVRTATFAGVAWLGTAIMLAAWALWRKRRIAVEQAACQALLQDYDGEGSV